ncbi:MAG: peptide deformylase [Planctomycetales bacterium]|nr:peptide deformylase [Planctomycetales bacterium]
MKIVKYPHPTLRHKSKPVQRVDAELKRIVAEMFELMYEARGIGLAANQVDLPLRLFIVNTAGEPGEGEEQVFINPVLSRPKGIAEKEEGCLSLPGLYAPVKRPERIRVNAYTMAGEEIDCELDGLEARVVQHETDHLDGVLFIDRLSETAQLAVADELDEFVGMFDEDRELKLIPSDEVIHETLATWESKYC